MVDSALIATSGPPQGFAIAKPPMPPVPTSNGSHDSHGDLTDEVLLSFRVCHVGRASRPENRQGPQAASVAARRAALPSRPLQIAKTNPAAISSTDRRRVRRAK